MIDGANQFRIHLFYSREHMLDPRARLANVVVAPSLAFRQRLVALSFSLHLVPRAMFLQPGFICL